MGDLGKLIAAKGFLKVAQSPIHRPISSHWLWLNADAVLIPTESLINFGQGLIEVLISQVPQFLLQSSCLIYYVPWHAQKAYVVPY